MLNSIIPLWSINLLLMIYKMISRAQEKKEKKTI